MAQVKSVEMDRMTASPVTVQRANAVGAKVRYYPFTFHTAAADAEGVGPLAAGDTLVLTRLPAGARIIRGYAIIGAMGTGADAQIGTVADPDRYSGLLDVAAASTPWLADTEAKFQDDILTEDTDIILTNPASGSATYATTTQPVVGWILASLT